MLLNALDRQDEKQENPLYPVTVSPRAPFALRLPYHVDPQVTLVRLVISPYQSGNALLNGARPRIGLTRYGIGDRGSLSLAFAAPSIMGSYMSPNPSSPSRSGVGRPFTSQPCSA